MVRDIGAPEKKRYMRRFFAGKNNIAANEIVIDDPGDVHHITNVLRLKTGAVIEISDSEDFEYSAEIISASQNCVRARILDKNKFAGEPDINITLFQSVPKQGKMESIVQKSTELGVSVIIPVFTARTVAERNGNIKGKILRWRKIAGEAAKQCRRGVVPQIEEEAAFSDMTDMIACNEFDKVIFPYENEKGRSIKDALRELEVKPKDIAVVIGPEGGFAEEEAEALTAAGADAVSLGRTVLRTETAGPAAIAMIMYELEL